jgi:hypothetical protein
MKTWLFILIFLLGLTSSSFALPKFCEIMADLGENNQQVERATQFVAILLEKYHAFTDEALGVMASAKNPFNIVRAFGSNLESDEIEILAKTWDEITEGSSKNDWWFEFQKRVKVLRKKEKLEVKVKEKAYVEAELPEIYALKRLSKNWVQQPVRGNKRIIPKYISKKGMVYGYLKNKSAGEVFVVNMTTPKKWHFANSGLKSAPQFYELENGKVYALALGNSGFLQIMDLDNGQQLRPIDLTGVDHFFSKQLIILPDGKLQIKFHIVRTIPSREDQPPKSVASYGVAIVDPLEQESYPFQTFSFKPASFHASIHSKNAKNGYFTSRGQIVELFESEMAETPNDKRIELTLIDSKTKQELLKYSPLPYGGISSFYETKQGRMFLLNMHFPQDGHRFKPLIFDVGKNSKPLFFKPLAQVKDSNFFFIDAEEPVLAMAAHDPLKKSQNIFLALLNIDKLQTDFIELPHSNAETDSLTVVSKIKQSDGHNFIIAFTRTRNGTNAKQIYLINTDSQVAFGLDVSHLFISDLEQVFEEKPGQIVAYAFTSYGPMKIQLSGLKPLKFIDLSKPVTP